MSSLVMSYCVLSCSMVFVCIVVFVFELVFVFKLFVARFVFVFVCLIAYMNGATMQ
jgi:hypothetical protein